MDTSHDSRFGALYAPVLEEIESRSAVADAFIDKDIYRIYVATLWANVVSQPDGAALEDADLEAFYDFLGHRISEVLGAGASVRDCFEYIVTREGQLALDRHRIGQRHRNLLHYFASLMLDPQGHEQRMDAHRRSE